MRPAPEHALSRGTILRIANKVKARLAAGETVTAAWLELGSPEVAEILVRTGWDVVVIDCEHGVAGLEDGLNLIRAVEAAGGDAVLRVPDPQESTLKRALDRGARSILVPMVNSAAMARDIAACCLYPPSGRRGYAAPVVRASGYGAWNGYALQAHEELLLMVQIEHADAVAHVADIVDVPGIDMVFVGPNDLAASLGLLERLGDPAVLREIEKVEEAATARKLPLGTIEGSGRDWRVLQQAGYRFIVGPNDVSLLASASRASAAARDSTLAD